MPGKGSKMRSDVQAIRAAKLADGGATHKEIAALLERPVTSMKALIERGRRLLHQAGDKPPT